MKVNVKKLPTKMIAGYRHYQRRCEGCRYLVWTQDTKLPVYRCNTCHMPRFGETLGNPRTDTGYDGSADNGVRVLEGG